MDSRYAQLEAAIRSGDVEAGTAEAARLAESGLSPLSIFRECIEPCLKNIGDQFSRLEIFLPEMMEAAEVVKAVQEALQPYLKAGELDQTRKGRLVLCTIQGDLHDIGKNIVKAMLEVNGFEVKDLGVNVNPADLIRSAREFDAHIIAISALMLPSLPYVKDAIEMVKTNDDSRRRFKIMVGGGPVSRDWANKVQADGYGDDAIEAVKQASSLMGL
jgi:methylmalonyl-CoA mutase cobalamin-binding domain/chain